MRNILLGLAGLALALTTTVGCSSEREQHAASSAEASAQRAEDAASRAEAAANRVEAAAQHTVAAANHSYRK